MKDGVSIEASINDRQLLRRFIEHNSQEAFAALTARYLNLVYSVCRRELADDQAAEDVTQAVFLILARKAPTLGRNVVLSGWLFQTARFAAKNARLQAQRRAAYEQKAAEAMQQRSQGREDATWSEVEPLLNRSLAALREGERECVLLRFFQGMNFAETGTALGLSEEAARKRVGRSLEKMRKFFEKGGVIVPGAALAVLLSAHAAKAAPAHLGAALSQPVAGVTTGSAYLLLEGVLHAMKIAQIKIASGLAGMALLGIITTYAVEQHAQALGNKPPRMTASRLGRVGRRSHAAPKTASQPKAARRPAALDVSQALTVNIGSTASDIQFRRDGQTLQIAAPARWRKEPYDSRGGKLMQMSLPGRNVRTLIAGMGEVATGNVALSPDGQMAAVLVSPDQSGMGPYHVQVWSVATARPVFALPDMGDISTWEKTGLLGLNFSADGTRLFTLQRGGDAEVWDVQQKKRVYQCDLQGGHVFENAALSPDALNIAYVGKDNVLRLCDVNSSKTRELGDNVSCHRLAFSPDGTLLAVATDRGIDLWSVPAGKKVRTLVGQTGFLSSLAFNRDGSQLACGTIQTGTKRPDWRGSVFVWEVANGQPLATIRGFTESVMSLALSPDGVRLAAGSNFESVVRIWKLKS